MIRDEFRLTAPVWRSCGSAQKSCGVAGNFPGLARFPHKPVPAAASGTSSSITCAVRQHHACGAARSGAPRFLPRCEEQRRASRPATPACAWSSRPSISTIPPHHPTTWHLDFRAADDGTQMVAALKAQGLRPTDPLAAISAGSISGAPAAGKFFLRVHGAPFIPSLAIGSRSMHSGQL
jgi:hypothetical protein